MSASSTKFVPERQLLLPFTMSQGQHFRNVKVWEKQNMSFFNITWYKLFRSC